jgi:muramoyltetrapeptide carboxypeptidase LdcA involved in peptidoglycan recycling
MFTQVLQSRALDGAAGLILGDFTNCNDEQNFVLKPPRDDETWEAIRRDRSTGEKAALRKVYEQHEAFEIIFGDVGKRLSVALARGLPVGHGPNYAPLPLGAQYELRPDGALRLVEWDWLCSPSPRAGRGQG